MYNTDTHMHTSPHELSLSVSLSFWQFSLTCCCCLFQCISNKDPNLRSLCMCVLLCLWLCLSPRLSYVASRTESWEVRCSVISLSHTQSLTFNHISISYQVWTIIPYYPTWGLILCSLQKYKLIRESLPLRFFGPSTFFRLLWNLLQHNFGCFDANGLG